MKRFEELELVNYCHPGCVPMLNIMRLPKDEAFCLADEMAEKHPETTAFYRFADFENYYALRLTQDEYLYERFKEMGGDPEEIHPLSFVVDGSDYLKEWFGNGPEIRLALAEVEARHISFTVGDSGAEFQRNGFVELLTLDEFRTRVEEHGDFQSFLASTGKHYVEVQLWSDRYIRKMEDK